MHIKIPESHPPHGHGEQPPQGCPRLPRQRRTLRSNSCLSRDCNQDAELCQDLEALSSRSTPTCKCSCLYIPYTAVMSMNFPSLVGSAAVLACQIQDLDSSRYSCCCYSNPLLISHTTSVVSHCVARQSPHWSPS